MIIIGGEQDPSQKMQLSEENPEKVQSFYYAKNVLHAEVQPSGEVRIPDYIPWPSPEITPEDARGWWVYGAKWDPQYVDIDYANRRVRLKKVGRTEISFTIENADGSMVDLVWELDILDKLTPLSVSIDPSYDTTATIEDLWRILAQVDGGDWPYTFRWYKDGIMLRERTTTDPMDKSDYLTFQSLTWAEEAVYRVEAYDRHGSVAGSTSFRLTITPKPFVFLNAWETVRLREGANWFDTIDFTGGKPPFSYSWLRGGNPTGINQKTIRIDGLTPADTSDYTLQVTDVLGTTATSPEGFHLYVMELLLTIAPATADATAVTTQHSNTRIGVNLDLADPARDYSFALAATRFRDGVAEPVTAVEVVDGNSAIVEVSPVVNGRVRLTPQALQNVTFMLRTADNRSETVQIEAKVVALPHFTAPLSAPLLLTNTSGVSQSVAVTGSLKEALTPETYQWQYKRATDSAWQNLANGQDITATITGPVGPNFSPVLYRLAVTNAYTTAPELSNELSQLFANLYQFRMARQDVYTTDPLIPAGEYTWRITPNATDTAPFLRGINDPGTDITWTPPAIPGVTFTVAADERSVTARVDLDVDPVSVAQALTVALSNANGTPVMSSSATDVLTVAVPVLDDVDLMAVVGREIRVATLTIPQAMTRIMTPVITVVSPDGAFTSRYDPLTGGVFLRGVSEAAEISTSLDILFDPPGPNGQFTYSIPVDVVVRKDGIIVADTFNLVRSTHPKDTQLNFSLEPDVDIAKPITAVITPVGDADSYVAASLDAEARQLVFKPANNDPAALQTVEFDYLFSYYRIGSDVAETQAKRITVTMSPSAKTISMTPSNTLNVYVDDTSEIGTRQVAWQILPDYDPAYDNTGLGASPGWPSHMAFDIDDVNGIVYGSALNKGGYGVFDIIVTNRAIAAMNLKRFPIPVRVLHLDTSSSTSDPAGDPMSKLIPAGTVATWPIDGIDDTVYAVNAVSSSSAIPVTYTPGQGVKVSPTPSASLATLTITVTARSSGAEIAKWSVYTVAEDLNYPVTMYPVGSLPELFNRAPTFAVNWRIGSLNPAVRSLVLNSPHDMRYDFIVGADVSGTGPDYIQATAYTDIMTSGATAFFGAIEAEVKDTATGNTLRTIPLPFSWGFGHLWTTNAALQLSNNDNYAMYVNALPSNQGVIQMPPNLVCELVHPGIEQAGADSNGRVTMAKDVANNQFPFTMRKKAGATPGVTQVTLTYWDPLYPQYKYSRTYTNVTIRP